MLVDTHCHLDFGSFDEDREEVIERARTSGIVRILNPGININSSKAAVELSEQYPEIYTAVGVHPNDGLSWNHETKAQLRQLAEHPKVVAIGEIGLDFYRDSTPKGLQAEIFTEQLGLAAELSLPVIIHSRDSIPEVLEILAAWCLKLEDDQSPMTDRPGVLHSFSGDENQAKKTNQLNLLIGITGPVTFRNAQELQDLVIRLPLDRLLVETDAPFLSPHPRRGKRNEPANVSLVAEKVADLHHEAYNNVTNITTANAVKLFNW